MRSGGEAQEKPPRPGDLAFGLPFAQTMKHLLSHPPVMLLALLTLAPSIRAAEVGSPPTNAAFPPMIRMAPPRLPDDVELIGDVECGKGGERVLKLNLIRPKNPPKEPMPVVVFIFGGAFHVGTRNTGIRHLSHFAQRGYVGAAIEYRYSQDARFPAQIEDCKCAIRFLRAKAKEYHLDPDRIGVWGPSAGGYLAALLGTTGDVKDLEGSGGWPKFSSRVQAVVDFYGPIDFLKLNAPGITLDHDAELSPESMLIGGAIQQNKDKVARANPLTYVSQDDPPFLILHGENDQIIPLNQSQLLADALEKVGVEHTFIPVKGAGHDTPVFYSRTNLDLVDAFFDRHLKGNAKAGARLAELAHWRIPGGWQMDGPGSRRRVLFFTKSSGFEHSVIKRPADGQLSHAEKILTNLGAQYGFEVTCTKDGSVFTPENIAKYDVFCFFTSGMLTESGTDKTPPMTLAGKAALLEAVQQGKGFLAIHAANDSFHFQPDEQFLAHGDKVDPYIAMLGGEFIRHGPQQTAKMIVCDSSFPGLADLQGGFEALDEWYTFKDFAKDMHVLLVQDTKGMNGIDYQRAPFPATWIRRQGKGRVFYTSMGHREDVWTNFRFQNVLLGGLGWVAGNVTADFPPNLDLAAPGYREIQPEKE